MTTATHTTADHTDADAAACPTCEARAVAADLAALSAELNTAAPHTTTAARVRDASYRLDYALALIDANILAAGRPL